MWGAIRCALCALMAGPVAADEAAIEAAWRDWVADNDIQNSTLAMTYNGAPMGAFGIGRAAGDAVPLASLSKAITGACILDLIDDGLISYDTQLRDIFADRPEFLQNGADITVDALLTHTSGFDFDRTQTGLNPTLWGASDMHDRISSLALGRELGPPDFFYNNENYAVLGSIIMEVTGRSVADVCAPRVLDGLETAAVNGRFGGGLAWAGWEMSVADYAQFASRLNVTDEWPGAPLGGAYYGPGVLLRDTKDGTNLWHFGALCLLGLGDFGSYFYVLDNGWGATVWYDICANGAQQRALDNALAGAAYSE